jgi:hypothetical protein
MDSRYGLMVAVGAIFVGVMAVAILGLPAKDAHRWPAHVCREINDYTGELGKMDQPADIKLAARAPLGKLWFEHCANL